MDERLYRSLYRIRRVEEEIARVYPTDRMFHIYHRPDGWTKAARAWWWVRAYVRGVWHALCMNSREWEDQ